MRDQWYADKRDLVKWGVLSILARRFGARRILQIAYYNESDYGEIEIDGEREPIPKEVLGHFRNIANVSVLAAPAKVSVFDAPFGGTDRTVYHEAAAAFVRAHHDGRGIVFLDPDTGLEPNGKADQTHVLNAELRGLWEQLPPGWVLVFYQHQNNMAGRPWVEPKRAQFAEALDVRLEQVRVAQAPAIARDVVFFFATRAERPMSRTSMMR